MRDFAFGRVGFLALYVIVAPVLGAVGLASTSGSWLPVLTGLDFGSAASAFLVVTVVAAAVSLAPTHAASLVGGMVFGAATGSILALLGIAIAAAVGFAALRWLVQDRVLDRIAMRPRAVAVHRALVRGGRRRVVGLIVLIRLSPVMPFAGTNLLMAAAGVGLRPFLLGSVIGLAPRVIIVAMAGAGLSTLQLGEANDLRLAILGVAATVVVLVVVSRVAGQALRDATETEADET